MTEDKKDKEKREEPYIETPTLKEQYHEEPRIELADEIPELPTHEESLRKLDEGLEVIVDLEIPREEQEKQETEQWSDYMETQKDIDLDKVIEDVYYLNELEMKEIQHEWYDNQNKKRDINTSRQESFKTVSLCESVKNGDGIVFEEHEHFLKDMLPILNRNQNIFELTQDMGFNRSCPVYQTNKYIQNLSRIGVPEQIICKRACGRKRCRRTRLTNRIKRIIDNHSGIVATPREKLFQLENTNRIFDDESFDGFDDVYFPAMVFNSLNSLTDINQYLPLIRKINEKLQSENLIGRNRRLLRDNDFEFLLNKFKSFIKELNERLENLSVKNRDKNYIEKHCKIREIIRTTSFGESTTSKYYAHYELLFNLKKTEDAEFLVGFKKLFSPETVYFMGHSLSHSFFSFLSILLVEAVELREIEIIKNIKSILDVRQFLGLVYRMPVELVEKDKKIISLQIHIPKIFKLFDMKVPIKQNCAQFNLSLDIMMWLQNECFKSKKTIFDFAMETLKHVYDSRKAFLTYENRTVYLYWVEDWLNIIPKSEDYFKDNSIWSLKSFEKKTLKPYRAKVELIKLKSGSWAKSSLLRRKDLEQFRIMFKHYFMDDDTGTVSFDEVIKKFKLPDSKTLPYYGGGRKGSNKFRKANLSKLNILCPCHVPTEELIDMHGKFFWCYPEMVFDSSTKKTIRQYNTITTIKVSSIPRNSCLIIKKKYGGGALVGYKEKNLQFCFNQKVLNEFIDTAKRIGSLDREDRLIRVFADFIPSVLREEFKVKESFLEDTVFEEFRKKNYSLSEPIVFSEALRKFHLTPEVLTFIIKKSRLATEETNKETEILRCIPKYPEKITITELRNLLAIKTDVLKNYLQDLKNSRKIEIVEGQCGGVFRP
jgi:hypothetical protein